MMEYRPKKKTWIKLWTTEWLTGTTRFELNPAERSIFVDFLILAVISRYPGVICAGKYEDGRFRGYPLRWLSGVLNATPKLILSTIEKCEKYEKIKVEKNEEDDETLYVIHIINWERFQSEYQRQRKYRIDVDEGLSPKEYLERYKRFLKTEEQEGKDELGENNLSSQAES